MKWLSFVLGSIIVIAAAVFVAVKFGNFEVQKLQREVDQLARERQRLLNYAERLEASHRVAQVEVLEQRRSAAGHTISTLRWQEIGPGEALGQPVTVEVVGTQAYFEALVLKFSHQLVGEGDPQRGTSVAMFRRIFGDHQAADSVPDLDRAVFPAASSSEQGSALHNELWGRFWELVDDPALASRYGVRVAECEAPAVPLQAGQVWEVTIDAAGGLNLKKLGTRATASRAASAKP